MICICVPVRPPKGLNTLDSDSRDSYQTVCMTDRSEFSLEFNVILLFLSCSDLSFGVFP